ncbi:UNVERIFIED_CONTAM: hypothetical protein GTU68_040375 [Idotea baltica]|nr:hypothetical protein [Idotea baltica]
MHCSIAQTLELIGEWWTLLILRDAFFGVTRFDLFHQRLGIARNVLTTRLNGLVEAGLMERRTYDESRGRTDYLLTEKGLALWPVIVSLRQWGDEWLFEEENRPVDVIHQSCGANTGFDMTCRSCGDTVGPQDLAIGPGPGAQGDELP